MCVSLSLTQIIFFYSSQFFLFSVTKVSLTSNFNFFSKCRRPWLSLWEIIILQKEGHEEGNNKALENKRLEEDPIQPLIPFFFLIFCFLDFDTWKRLDYRVCILRTRKHNHHIINIEYKRQCHRIQQQLRVRDGAFQECTTNWYHHKSDNELRHAHNKGHANLVPQGHFGSNGEPTSEFGPLVYK